MRKTVIEAILSHRLIAIVRNVEIGLALPLAEALYKGGVRLMELTFAQKDEESFAATAKGIAAVREGMAGRMLVGAGTVLTLEQLRLAYEAGAGFIVSPNVDEAVIQNTRKYNMVSLPGVLTASEAIQAHKAGADFIKLFPAGNMGPAYLKALCAPLSHLKFLAVGGIDANNAADFIHAGAAGVGVGGNLVNHKWINTGEFDRITDAARAVVDACLLCK